MKILNIKRNTKTIFGTELEFLLGGDYIILKRYAPSCIICEDIENMEVFKGKVIWSKCKVDFKFI